MTSTDEFASREAAILEELADFTGTFEYRRHPIGGIEYTDGVQRFLELTNGGWILDFLGTYQATRLTRSFPFQVWCIQNRAAEGTLVAMFSDLEQPPVVHHTFDRPDFPLRHYELYCVDKIVLLKSEY